MSASDNIARQSLEGAAQAVEGARGLKVPVPHLILLLMVLVILSVFDILKKSYDVHEEANYRVAKAALEITLSRTQSGLNGIASRIAAEQSGFDGALPEVFFTGEAADKDLSTRTLFLAFDGKRRLLKGRVGHRKLDQVSLTALAGQPALRDLFSSPESESRQSNPLVVTVDGVPFILSDPQPLEGVQSPDGATLVVVALPVRDLLYDELEKYEVFGSGQLKSYLERKNDLSSLTELIVSLQKKDYTKFHFKAVAQIVIVLVAFVISVMIGHHIDRKNDALRQSRDAISEREQEAQRLRREAEQASEAKTRFIQNMSHELRTPLNAVIGFSEIITDQKLGPVTGEYRDCATEINASGNHLLALINDILDMSRIESGFEEVIKEDIDVRELVQAVFRRTQVLATEGRVRLALDIPETLPGLRSDARRVKQVLMQLMTNAIKFTPEGGRVLLSVKQAEKGGFLFEIADNGVGMSPEDQDKALTLFAQVDGKLSRRHEGSGLGLPLTKASIELLGGSFDIKSEFGAGTTVTVFLPLEPDAAKSVA